MMNDAGVHVERYHPLHWFYLARMNNRTHRTLLAVAQMQAACDKLAAHAYSKFMVPR
jgi:hypothetical protein